METLDLIFMMNVSVVRASFNVFNLLSVADNSNINTFIFKNHCIMEKNVFLLSHESKLLFLESGKVENVILKSFFTVKKNERMEMC